MNEWPIISEIDQYVKLKGSLLCIFLAKINNNFASNAFLKSFFIVFFIVEVQLSHKKIK